VLLRISKLICIAGISGCTTLVPSTAPTVETHDLIETENQLDALNSDIKWEMKNLKPDEDETLVDGNLQQFSIDVHFRAEHAARSNYVVFFKSDKKIYHPFKIDLLNAEGAQADFAATVTWYAKACGKDQYISMNLYRVENYEPKLTKTTTLLKQIERKYRLICNRNEIFLVRLFKHMFNLCYEQ
jgi:hypothetical protein